MFMGLVSKCLKMVSKCLKMWNNQACKRLQRKTTILLKEFQLRHSVKTIPGLASLSRSQAERPDDKGGSEGLLRASPSPGTRAFADIALPPRGETSGCAQVPVPKAISVSVSPCGLHCNHGTQSTSMNSHQPRFTG